MVWSGEGWQRGERCRDSKDRQEVPSTGLGVALGEGEPGVKPQPSCLAVRARPGSPPLLVTDLALTGGGQGRGR